MALGPSRPILSQEGSCLSLECESTSYTVKKMRKHSLIRGEESEIRFLQCTNRKYFEKVFTCFVYGSILSCNFVCTEYNKN